MGQVRLSVPSILLDNTPNQVVGYIIQENKIWQYLQAEAKKLRFFAQELFHFYLIFKTEKSVKPNTPLLPEHPS